MASPHITEVPAGPKLRLIIGNKNYSSWSLRPWLVLRHLQIAFEEVRLALDTPAFAAQIGALSPTGLVPVLHVGDFIVSDSMAIIEYINDALAPGRAWPQDRQQRAIARAISARMHSGFDALRAELPMNCRLHGNQINVSEQTERQIDEICAIWRECRAKYGQEGPWLFGEFSAADAFYAPVALRFNTYVVPVDPVCDAYIEAMLAFDPLAEWIDAARREPEVIEREEVGKV
jgi:glutathione S-transferase